MKKEIVEELLRVVKKEYNFELTSSEIIFDENPKKGDLSTNIAFKLAKEVGKAPAIIAETLANGLTSKDVKAESAGGFLNFYFSDDFYKRELAGIITAGEKYGEVAVEGITGKKIQVEYISANPTGPFTLGNGRGGFGGEALARVFEKAGAKIQREYYVNDGGNQIKVLGDAIKVAAGIMETKEEVYKGKYIDDWVKEHPKEIKEVTDSFELGSLVAKDILENFIKPGVKKLDIKYDQYFHEKDMVARGEVEEAIAKLKEYKMTKEEDGALWFKAKDFGDTEDRVLVKSDGEKTYFANDIAYHFDKLYKRKFDKVVDFWGADHQGHVKKMQAAIAALGCPGHVDIVIFQLVRLIKDGQEFKMSKRKGTYITMDDLLELIAGTEELDAKKLRDAADVARFFFLSREFNTHMDFDLDLAREHSEKNPVFYVKYAYARIHGILAKAGIQNTKVDLRLIKEKEELSLIKELVKLPGLVSEIASSKNYPVHKLTFYAREVATKFHSFYDKCQVIDEENLELTAARLELVKETKIVLRIVMEDLIGIEAPERM